MAARKRIDPAPRPLERPPLDQIVNADPDRKYVAVSPHATEFGVDYYTAILGYEVEKVRPGGPRFAFRRPLDSGQPETSGYGMVLVSCSAEHARMMDEAGQAQVTAVEKRIVRDRGGVDALRGFRSGAGTVEIHNETSPSFVEQGA